MDAIQTPQLDPEKMKKAEKKAKQNVKNNMKSLEENCKSNDCKCNDCKCSDNCRNCR